MTINVDVLNKLQTEAEAQMPSTNAKKILILISEFRLLQERLQSAEETLNFYANQKNYWGKPIPLDLNLDRRTLKIVHEADSHNVIAKDFGQKAQSHLEKWKLFERTEKRL